MAEIPLYPLRFEPIYQYRPWGGRRLAELLDVTLPGDGPIGESWILSDRDDHASRVADGPLQGQTITQLMERMPAELLGRAAGSFRRFPLLLKFLDAQQMLSVQVHPSDRQKAYLPAGESGKTEAWVVLEAGPRSRIDVGLKPGATADTLRQALAQRTIADDLPGFTPHVGDAVFLPAGTVHALGDGVVVFEVQQNSDVTFRLYDWDRVDQKTGKPRSLQVDEALACVDFAQGVLGPVAPVVESTTPLHRERLFQCDHFTLWRLRGAVPFTVGSAGAARVAVCLEGAAELEHAGVVYPLAKGDVVLLPAVVGECFCRAHGDLNLLELALPELP